MFLFEKITAIFLADWMTVASVILHVKTSWNTGSTDCSEVRPFATIESNPIIDIKNHFLAIKTLKHMLQG